MRSEGTRGAATAVPFRLAVVGCGAIAEQAHIPAAARVENVVVAGLVDTDIGRAQAMASKFGIERGVSRLDDLAGHIDGVVLATPPHIRSVLAQQALAQGLHVLCEKPMANSSAECHAMLGAAAKAQRTLAVGHNYRFFPNRVFARNQYKSGALGRMINVNVAQGDPFGGSSRTLYTLRREMVPGGVLLNDGVHILDLLLWWFGEPESFEYLDDSLGGLESNVDVTLRYREGGTAHFRLSRTSSFPNVVDMQFEHGALVFPIYDMSTLTLERNGRSERMALHTTPWDFVEIAALQLRDFVRAAVTGAPPAVSGDEGLLTVRFIESCYQRAAQRTRPPKTPLPGVPW